MNANFVLVGLFLVLLVVPVVVSQDEISQANRFLAAETTRQITVAKQELLRDVQSYQDENFRLLDSRMQQLMIDLKWKVMLSSLGAVLVAMGLVAFFLIRTMQHYSFEKYQERLLQRSGVGVDSGVGGGRDFSGVNALQQSAWSPQESNPTLSSQFGQAAASNMTQMNSWQMQPAYDGSWQSPERPVQRADDDRPWVNSVPGGYQTHSLSVDSEDPMDSPGWSPQ